MPRGVPATRIPDPVLDGRAIGARIRRARKARKWTLEKLSTVSGLAVGTLSTFECGARVPSLIAAVRISRALGKSLSYLIDGRWSDAWAKRGSFGSGQQEG